MNEIHLPDAAWDDVEAGTEALLEEWLAQPGDAIQAGQPVAIVVMVKTSIEVEAPADGVLGPLLIEAGATVAQGQPLATVRAA
ncbi:MAG: lipoyl domain-containing protein [Pseudomonadota bacterium]